MSDDRGRLDLGGGRSLDPNEISYTFSRAGGPGGQAVNKVSTRVTLRFDLLHSASLTPEERELASERLAAKLTSRGEIVIHADRHRDRASNIADARERLATWLTAALHVAAHRRPTRPTRGSVTRRLAAKRHRKDAKRRRHDSE